MAVLDTLLLVGLMLQIPAAVDAQGTTPSPGPHDTSVDRIRVRLAEPPLIAVPPGKPLFTTGPNDRPLFKVHVQGTVVSDWDWLDNRTSVPAYVWPPYNRTHYEFLMKVTPEAFRAATVYPIGVPVLSVVRAIADGPLKRRREASARREVKEALAAFEASRPKVLDQTAKNDLR